MYPEGNVLGASGVYVGVVAFLLIVMTVGLEIELELRNIWEDMEQWAG